MSYFDFDIGEITNATWNTKYPDVSIRFEKTDLVWIPCAFLWISLPLEIYYLRHSKAMNIPFNPYNVTKLITIALMSALSLTDTINYEFYENIANPIYAYSSLIKFLTFGLFFGLTVANIKFGIRSSGTLFLFSLLLVVFGAPEFRTKLIRKNEYVSPENESSFVSKILYIWFDRFIWKGYKKSLENDDLWNLDYDNTSAVIVPKFEKIWNASLIKIKKEIPTNTEEKIRIETKFTKSDKEASITTSILSSFGNSLLNGWLLKILADSISFVYPLILGLLIDFLNEDQPIWHGYLYACLLFIFAALQIICLAKYFHLILIVGLRIKAALLSVIYEKALRISNGAKKKFTTGEIINVMSVDAQRFVDFSMFVHLIWTLPFTTFLVMLWLWQILGPSSLVGFTLLIILILINNSVASKNERLQIMQMKIKDNRIKLMSEVFSGIKILKLCAWEPKFEKQILQTRTEEIKILKKQSYLNAYTSFIWAFSPFLVSLVTFGAYVLTSDKNILNAKIAFVSLSLFNILKIPMLLCPNFISYLMHTIVAIKRINKFLNLEELNPNAVSHENIKEPLIIEDGVFSWDGYDNLPILNNINVKISSGKLVAVVGPVGCGKSSLISAFLGEMYKQSGFVNTNGSIAYVPQQAWIQNATVKDNITFGKVVNQSIYRQAVEACALKMDLEILPAGDQTEIGEKGINLSGEQKQRISLARAVCFDADIYFLDDPLSAVDSHVGKHIFDYVIGPNGLLRKKTRIFVTHNITYLPQVDFIIVLKNGSISESGTYNELLKKKGPFAEFLFTYLNQDSNVEEKEDLNKLEENLADKTIFEGTVRPHSKSESVQYLDNRIGLTGIANSIRRKQRNSTDIINKKLTKSEEIQIGNIKWEVVTYYIKFAGVFSIAIAMILYFMFQTFTIGASIWLSKWCNDIDIVVNGTANYAKTNYYLSIYTLLGICQGVSIFICSFTLFTGTLRVSSKVHKQLLQKIFHWPMSTFDITPIGRIISRFGFDFDVLDHNITMNFQLMLQYGSVKFYAPTSRQLKRLESVSRSPIHSHFNETIIGAQSIRAFRLHKKCIKELQNKVDINHKCYYHDIISNRWLSIRLGIISSVIILFTALIAVFERNSVTAGLVGLSIGCTLQLTTAIFWFFVIAFKLETDIISVEQIKQYIETSEEQPWRIPNELVPENWPSKGEISFVDFSVRYRENLELVLKGVNFCVNGGEKVGIVGRTGSGKSSLTLSLFRIIESASGKILLDGIDISSVGLHALRSRITIIPQDPVLFSGTLRINLDPLSQYSDEQIWHALELIHFKTFVSRLNCGLLYEIKENGQNFSVGQRQLVCLARAILHDNKVLVLDEASSGTDLETDNLIQITIRTIYKNHTVLTIAHRLNTIMDYDRILVLDEGMIIEYDAPDTLLKNKNSFFYKMAADAGLV
ncbi:hypothetical protein PGB90_010298 [Kerria lacca]